MEKTDDQVKGMMDEVRRARPQLEEQLQEYRARRRAYEDGRRTPSPDTPQRVVVRPTDRSYVV